MKKTLRTFNFLFILTFFCTTSLFAAATATVTWKYVNLRESPTKDAQVIAKLVKGSVVTILDVKDEWYEIQTAEEITGWLVQRSAAVSDEEPEELTETALEEAGVEAEAPPIAPKAPAVKEALVTFDEKGRDQKKMYASEEDDDMPFSDSGEDGFLKLSDKKMPESPSFTGAFFRMLSALFIILAAILFIYYFIRKYFGRSIRALEGSSAITVLASKYIGQKTIIYMIDVMEKVVVVAVSGSEIKPLTEIEDTKSIERIRAQITKLKESEKPFKKLFFDRLRENPAVMNRPKEENFDILDELNDKIKDKVDKIEP